MSELERITGIFEGFEPPPFDDPKYIQRCNKSWKFDHEAEVRRLKDRWVLVCKTCIAGGYGYDVKEDWQRDYGGMNIETASEKQLISAVNAIWVIRGIPVIEKLPILKKMDGDFDPNTGRFTPLSDSKVRAEPGPAPTPLRDWNEPKDLLDDW